jgi:hypothetical protein
MRKALIMGMLLFMFLGSASRTIAWDYLNEDVLDELSNWWFTGKQEFDLSEKKTTRNSRPPTKPRLWQQALRHAWSAIVLRDKDHAPIDGNLR